MTGEPLVERHGTYGLVRVLPRPVKVLLAARLVNRIGAFSMPFLSVLLVQELGARVTVAGLVVGVFGVATIPSRLMGGVLAQRLGARGAVIIGLLGTAGAQLVIAAAPSLFVALLGAFLLGLCFEIYEPASQALIADVTPDDLLPRTYGLLGATLAVAGLLAGVVAALVGGVGLRWLFVVDAATALACVVLVAALLPAGRLAGAREAERSPSAWRDPRLWVLMMTGTAFATVYLSVPMAMPLALVAAGSSAPVAGWLEAASALVVIAAQPLLTHRGSLTRRLVLGYAVMTAGLLVAAAVPTLYGYVGATIVISVGDVLLLGYAYALVARIAPEGARASYFAAYGTTWGVALTVGPPAMGWLMHAGPRIFWASCAAAMLLTGAATALASRRLLR